MEEFKRKIWSHVEHIQTVSDHCTTEETTKQALILPLLKILDFSPFDPQKVKAEHAANFPGAKSTERVDYALFSDGSPVMFIEAKPRDSKLTNHDGQLSRYFNATPSVAIAAITNGVQWRFFTDLRKSNVMDETPFFTVNFDKLNESDIEQLAKFRYDMFSPDLLKSFAEERNYLDLFKSTIGTCLRDVDQDFVRFIATRSNLTPKLTTKFLENIAPLVRQSLKEAISEMVVCGLSTPVRGENVAAPTAPNEVVPDGSVDAGNIVDPDNPRIITTVAERKVLALLKEILSGVTSEDDIVGKDTESYYSVLYQNKTNRWILRYVEDKKRQLIYFPIELTESHRAWTERCGLSLGPGGSVVIDKPESIMRISNIVFDSFSYCQDNGNFKRERISRDVASAATIPTS
jgi:predicted type IV restriction endonuclease